MRNNFTQIEKIQSVWQESTIDINSGFDWKTSKIITSFETVDLLSRKNFGATNSRLMYGPG